MSQTRQLITPLSAEKQNLSDGYHQVLSVSPAPTQPSLRDYLPPDKAQLLGSLSLETQGAALLTHVIVEPKDMTENSLGSTVHPGILQQGVRLSQSKLWDILLNYYAQQGINAWQHNVPSFGTSSVYCAESYAEAIIAFLKDYYGRLDLSQPVYIVEMATGTGRFSFHLLRELERKLSCFSALQGIDLRYVMTDFTESNVRFWQSHIRLQPYIESGKLDFAVFNPLTEQRLSLVVSGQELNSASMQNPVIAIGNYFFDSTPVDRFQVQGHCLKEGLVTLKRNQAGVDSKIYPHISEIEVEFEYRALADHHYYEDAELNAILGHYCREFEAGNLLFPLGAFDVVRNLRQLANDRLVLLSSDKGFSTDQIMMRDYATHEFSIHDGTFSYMVNYGALALYFQNMGGQCFRTTLGGLGVQTVCLLSMSDGVEDYERLRYQFSQKIDRYNPINSLSDILNVVTNKKNELVFDNEQLLTMLRMQLGDAYAVSLLRPHLNQMISQPLSNEERLELIRLLNVALDNYYYHPGEADIPLCLAPIFYGLEEYKRSLFCWSIPALNQEPEAINYLGAGLCYEKMEKPSEAIAHFEMAIQMEPDAVWANKAQNSIKYLKETLGLEQTDCDNAGQQGE